MTVTCSPRLPGEFARAGAGEQETVTGGVGEIDEYPIRVIANLKLQAELKGKSLEQELRDVLTAAVPLPVEVRVSERRTAWAKPIAGFPFVALSFCITE